MVRLSPKHGVNPSIAKCYFCGGDTGEVILAGRLKGDVEAPREAVWHKHPCPACVEYMKQGVIIIGALPPKREGEEPERTGHFMVVSDDFIRRNIVPKELADTILHKRVAFMEREACDILQKAFAAQLDDKPDP